MNIEHDRLEPLTREDRAVMTDYDIQVHEYKMKHKEEW